MAALRNEAMCDKAMECITDATVPGGAPTQRLVAFARKPQLDHWKTDLNKLDNGVIDLSVEEGVTLCVATHPKPLNFLSDDHQLESALLNSRINCAYVSTVPTRYSTTGQFALALRGRATTAQPGSL